MMILTPIYRNLHTASIFSLHSVKRKAHKIFIAFWYENNSRMRQKMVNCNINFRFSLEFSGLIADCHMVGENHHYRD